ncbi:hypothetical protein HPP92_027511 [Vanilla planifolia]|uniref:Uncharacterized protein n=1 Tax=Vanilla planifolia TaxID=51239 RepID=A0A835PBK6_VANPL|nr:hypothetical protein HPP92_027511 [Vanilla planifolia]KAG0449084.1 hypothetical protein HPP92_027526 [Vanilla planifolia]
MPFENQPLVRLQVQEKDQVMDINTCRVRFAMENSRKGIDGEAGMLGGDLEDIRQRSGIDSPEGKPEEALLQWALGLGSVRKDQLGMGRRPCSKGSLRGLSRRGATPSPAVPAVAAVAVAVDKGEKEVEGSSIMSPASAPPFWGDLRFGGRNVRLAVGSRRTQWAKQTDENGRSSTWYDMVGSICCTVVIV